MVSCRSSAFMCRRPWRSTSGVAVGPAAQSWRTFRVLFVFVVLSHDRRRIVHVNVTAHPTAAWTAQQLREAWPGDTAPRFVIRDRDAICGSDLRRTVQQMGTEEVVTAPRSPWQNPFVERVTGSLRRECLDQVIVWNERSLRRHLQRTSSTITRGALTSRWTRMLPCRGWRNRPAAARSCESHTLAVYITTTNVAPPNRRSRRQPALLDSPVVWPRWHQDRASVVHRHGARRVPGS
jgi:hypothetical protein